MSKEKQYIRITEEQQEELKKTLNKPRLQKFRSGIIPTYHDNEFRKLEKQVKDLEERVKKLEEEKK